MYIFTLARKLDDVHITTVTISNKIPSVQRGMPLNLDLGPEEDEEEVEEDIIAGGLMCSSCALPPETVNTSMTDTGTGASAALMLTFEAKGTQKAFTVRWMMFFW